MKFNLQETVYLYFPGVFGADEDKVVKVNEGDYVTLNPDLTKIKGFNLILWRFRGAVIAQINTNKISYEDDEVFRDRLELNQTGSLTITNIRTNHSGLYKAEIGHDTGTLYQTFSVNVLGEDIIYF